MPKSTFISMWLILAAASSVAFLLNSLFQMTASGITREVFSGGGPLLQNTFDFYQSPLIWVFSCALACAKGYLVALYYGAKKAPAILIFLASLLMFVSTRFFPLPSIPGIDPVLSATAVWFLLGGLPVAWWFWRQRRNPLGYLGLTVGLGILSASIYRLGPAKAIYEFFNFNELAVSTIVQAIIQIAMALPVAYWIAHLPKDVQPAEPATIELYASSMTSAHQTVKENSEEVRA